MPRHNRRATTIHGPNGSLAIVTPAASFTIEAVADQPPPLWVEAAVFPPPPTADHHRQPTTTASAVSDLLTTFPSRPALKIYLFRPNPRLLNKLKSRLLSHSPPAD